MSKSAHGQNVNERDTWTNAAASSGSYSTFHIRHDSIATAARTIAAEALLGRSGAALARAAEIAATTAT